MTKTSKLTVGLLKNVSNLFFQINIRGE